MVRKLVIIACTFVVTLMSTSAMAQAPGPIGGNVTLKVRNARNGANPLGAGNEGDAKVLQVIGTTGSQNDQISSLKKQIFGDLAKFRQEHAGDRKALGAEQRQSLKTYYSGLQGILNTDQLQKYNLWLKGRRYLAGANDLVALQSLQLDNDTMAKIRDLKANEAKDAETALLTHLDNEQVAAAAVQRAHDAYYAYLQTALTSEQWKAYQTAVANPPAKQKGGFKKQI
jgi:hypothetical protein